MVQYQENESNLPFENLQFEERRCKFIQTMCERYRHGFHAVTRSADAQKDLLQDFALNIAKYFESIDKLENDKVKHSYVYKIYQSTIADYYRDQRTHSSIGYTALHDPLIVVNSREEQIAKDRIEHAKKIVTTKLSPKAIRIFNEIFLKDVDRKAFAESMGMNIGALNQQISFIKAVIKKNTK